MGVFDDKKKIITQIGVFNSIGKQVELPDSNNTLPSLNNKNEPIPFMLDVLSVMIGSQVLERTTGQVMTEYVRKSEPQLKSALQKQTVTHNSSQNLPAGFITGYDLPMKSVDVFGKLKTDPASSDGSIIYGNNSNNFDKSLYNAIQNAGSDVTYGSGSGAITINYDSSTDKIRVKPVQTSQTIQNFTTNFINGLTILNEKEFTSRVIDQLFGTVSASQNKNLTQLKTEENFNMTVQKILNGDDDLELTQSELLEVNKKATEKLEGKAKVDVGCSIIDSNVSMNDLKTLINNNTGTTDPTTIGKNFSSLIDNSFGKDDSQVDPSNKNAIRDGFFKRLIDTIKNVIIESITTTPQIRLLTAIVGGLKNNNDITDSLKAPALDIASKRNLIKCLADSAELTINEFLFNLVKTELIKIIVPVAAAILREKIKAYINIIKSLV